MSIYVVAIMIVFYRFVWMRTRRRDRLAMGKSLTQLSLLRVYWVGGGYYVSFSFVSPSFFLFVGIGGRHATVAPKLLGWRVARIRVVQICSGRNSGSTSPLSSIPLPGRIVHVRGGISGCGLITHIALRDVQLC